MPVTGLYGPALPAVVLAVDTARQSGWAVRVRGRHAASGELDTLDAAAVSQVVGWTLRVARRTGLAAVLVLEAPWGGRVNVVASLGAARERWLVAWRMAGQSERRVVRVQPRTWRCAVLGRGATGTRDVIRAREQRAACGLLGLAATEIGGDEAAAVLIGVWAARAEPVARVLGLGAGVNV
jgi:hypothetical protein